MTKPRLTPQPESEWSAEARAVLTRNRLGVSKAGVPNVLATLARHGRLLETWYPFAGFLMTGTKLPARDRELLILRTAWLCRSVYEWGQHVVFARGVGLSDEEIDRVRGGSNAPGWTAAEATLLRAVEELRERSTLADSTWSALGETYDDEECLEVLFTFGQYSMLANVLNVLGVELDEGTKGFDVP